VVVKKVYDFEDCWWKTMDYRIQKNNARYYTHYLAIVVTKVNSSKVIHSFGQTGKFFQLAHNYHCRLAFDYLVYCIQSP